MARKKKRGLKRLGSKLAKGAKKAGKFVKKSVGMVLLGPLLPFKAAMIAALKKKGAYSKGMSFKNVITKFFNEYVSKKNNKK